ncbi:hypothetical protein ACIB24_18035 [Spongisporangium articulatum]|uniref:Glycosyltransferase RgtA/B/C/D-like domain-containing protein n=1 Tax=Spongisporangium articulatum TaxID=3362603 RepID=A0ABW8ASV8_9ACTN
MQEVDRVAVRRPGLIDDVDDPYRYEADSDLTLGLPGWLAAVVRRRREAFTRTDAVAGALLLAQVAVLALLVGRGSLYLDDLRAQAATLNTSFVSFVLSPADGPFAPVPRLVDWVQATRFPLEHWPATFVALFVRVALGVAFYRLLRRLVGPRLLITVPLAVMLFTPALLTATVWERPALTVLAATAAGLWAVDAFAAWQLQRQARSLVVVAAATLLACACHVSGIAVPAVLLALQLTVLAGRSRWPGALLGLIASAVPAAAFLGLYLTRSGAAGTPAAPHAPADVAGAVGRALLHQVVPGLLGGPYGWDGARAYAVVLSPGTTLTVLFWAVAVVGFGVAVRRGPGRTARAAGFFALVLVAAAAVASVARTDAVGVLFSRADLLTVLLVPYLVLAASIAAFPAADASEAPEAGEASDAVRYDHPAETPLPPAELASGVPMTRRERRLAEAAAQTGLTSQTSQTSQTTRTTWTTRTAGAPAPRTAATAVPERPREIGTGGLTLAVVVAAVLAGSLVSTVTYGIAWWDNPTGRWLSTMRGYVGDAEAYPRILATPLPRSIQPDAQSRVFPSSAPLVLLIRPDARFHDADGQSRSVNDTGALDTPLTANLGMSESSGCVGSIRGGQRTTRWLRLSRDVPYQAGAQIEVGFLSATGGRVEVSMQTPQGRQLTPVRYSDVELPAGAHRMHVAVNYGRTVHAVKVGFSGGGNFCVTSLSVWVPYR